jgi:cobalamin biosynthetic protein CobC
MTDSDLPAHGGDLAFARKAYGEPPEGWLDLSTGINPVPYLFAPALLTPDVLHRLPDRAALAGLEAAACAAYHVPERARLVAVPGSEIAIRLMPRLAPPGAPAFLLAPIYGGHRAAWPHGTPVATPDAVPDGAVAVLANPNNPDGRVLLPSALAALARRSALVIVDEAFADVAPEASLATLLPENVLVLRSVGKFYGLAGVRLGFVIGAGDMIVRVGAMLGDWAVSGPAIAIGTAALADTGWRDATRARLRADAAALRALLAAHGLAVAGGTDLFALVATADARALHRALAERGIWTRAFAENPAWLRIGLPGAGFARLERALSDLG